MSGSDERSVDVAILGGGLAANFLARLLRIEQPDVSVALFEKSDEHRWKVGESTVEVASNFMVRKLRLGTYLFDEHLPKIGLRFFFDTPERNAELTEMSEIGTDRPPTTHSFQLDRARIETDLRRMNAEMGAEVNIGWTVRSVDLGTGGAPHRVTVRSDGEERVYRARWVVDATGRASMIARQRDLRVEEPIHKVDAIWGRYANVRDINQVGDEPWRRRARFVPRLLSTNHFCYRGYWIWFIPLNRGITSVGVVGEKGVFRRGMRQQDVFRAFIDEHRAPGYLMEGSEPLDIEGFSDLAYGVRQFFSADRWGLIGDAAAFADPFYSPGSDFISLECDHMNELIKRDRAGDNLEERVAVYNEFMQYRWLTAMLIYRNQYSTFGSYELMRAKYNFDFSMYLNVIFDPFALDKHLSIKEIRSELRRKDEALRALEEFGALFLRVQAHLDSRGAYHRANVGRYSLGADTARFLFEEMGVPRKKMLVFQRTAEVFEHTRAACRKLLEDHPPEEPGMGEPSRTPY